MSFERFSTSDVYVGGFIQCCGCWFVDWDADSFPEFKTPRKALEHLYRHSNAGHNIGKADIRIIEEYPDLDIEIQPYVRPHPPKAFRDVGNAE
jgi:hypothetical protein